MQLGVGLCVQVQHRFVERSEPAIHIFAGLKVCIQVMTPTTFGAAFASRISCRIASRDVVGRASTDPACDVVGLVEHLDATTCCDWAATWVSTSSPYSVWLPVRNQTSLSARSGAMLRPIT